VTPFALLLVGCSSNTVIPAPEGVTSSGVAIGHSVDDLWFDDRNGHGYWWDGQAWSGPVDVGSPALAAASGVLLDTFVEGSDDTWTEVSSDGTTVPFEGPPVPVLTYRTTGAAQGVTWVSSYAREEEDWQLWRSDGVAWTEVPAPDLLAGDLVSPTLLPTPSGVWLVRESYNYLGVDYPSIMAQWDGVAWATWELGEEAVFGRNDLFVSGEVLYGMVFGTLGVLRCDRDACGIENLDLNGGVQGDQYDALMALIPWRDGVAILSGYTRMAGEYDQNVTRIFEAWPIDLPSPQLGSRSKIGTYSDFCEYGCDRIGIYTPPRLSDGSVVYRTSDGFAVLGP
jgi:hypothetical protein